MGKTVQVQEVCASRIDQEITFHIIENIVFIIQMSFQAINIFSKIALRREGFTERNHFRTVPFFNCDFVHIFHIG
jgi:hypothetical protein